MKIATIFLALLAGNCFIARGGDDIKILELIERFGKLKHTQQYRDAYRALFAETDARDLVELQTLADDSNF